MLLYSDTIFSKMNAPPAPPPPQALQNITKRPKKKSSQKQARSSSTYCNQFFTFYFPDGGDFVPRRWIDFPVEYDVVDVLALFSDYLYGNNCPRVKQWNTHKQYLSAEYDNMIRQLRDFRPMLKIFSKESYSELFQKTRDDYIQTCGASRKPLQNSHVPMTASDLDYTSISLFQSEEHVLRFLLF